MVMFGGKRAYGENGRTGQTADPSAQMGGFGLNPATAASAPAPEPVSDAYQQDPVQPAPYEPEPMPGTDVPPEQKMYQPPPDFVSEPVLSQPPDQTPWPPAVGLRAQQAGPLAFLTRKIFGVPVWLVAGAAAAWWWRRK